MTYLLDTQAWVWWSIDSSRLPAKTKRHLEAKTVDLIVSSISIVELGTLVAKGRIKLTIPFDDWVKRATIAAGIRVIAVDEEIAKEAAQLPGGFHFEPADRIITATARVKECTIVTADESIQGYTHVKTIW